MKTGLSVLSAAGVVSLFALAGGCRRQSIEDRVDALPPLPASVADTLDPRTHATKIPASYPAPEKASGPVLAPCCGSSDFKTLQVRFSYTKCAPLRDFIVVRLLDAVFSDGASGAPAGAPAATPPGGQAGGVQATVKAYRLGERNARSVWDTTVCLTSDGPWSAAFREDRSCIGYTPQDSLLITAFGDPLLFVWNGGSANHPAGIDLVSCRQVADLRSPCNPLSSCECLSTTCPADQPCSCTLQW
jgi:hypothetical protein